MKLLDQDTHATSSLSSSVSTEVTQYQRAKSYFRYVESVAPGLNLEMELNSILHTSTSEYQEIQVIDSYFGRTLVTDGKTQSSEHDEFVYHESLVHPSLFWAAIMSSCNTQNGVRSAAPFLRTEATSMHGPKSVFIGGGGELATAREVLRHSTIERCVMVDIDPDVVDVCKMYLPEWGGEAVINHPKMEYIVGDAYSYLMETNEKFDVIIMDISDPIEAGPGISLYTKEFYERALQVLHKPHGVFVTQAGSADFIPHPHSFPEHGIEDQNKETCCFSPIKNTLKAVFDHVVPYTCPIASFGGEWGFVMAFNGPTTTEKMLTELPSESIDEMIEDRITFVPGVLQHKYRSQGVKRAVLGTERGGEILKHYDGIIHKRMFALSKPLREAMKCDDRVITMANPIFMY